MLNKCAFLASLQLTVASRWWTKHFANLQREVLQAQNLINRSAILVTLTYSLEHYVLFCGYRLGHHVNIFYVEGQIRIVGSVVILVGRHCASSMGCLHYARLRG
jgi:hypothetical protein